jgi:O-antigen/teichoic acid export membrane protein
VNQSLKEKTAKGLFWGGLSNGVQQLLNLVFGIFLARMLHADDYGMVGVLAIFSLIAVTLQESGFIAAIANKKDVKHEDYNAVFWFNILLSFCLYAVLFFCAPLIAVFYGIPELTPLARYCFLGFFISSFGVAQHAYLFRHLMVKQKAIAQVSGLILSGITGIILAYNGMAYWGIATQSLVYITSIVVCYWILSPWRPTFNIDFQPLRSMIGFSSKLLITNIFMHINDNIFSVLLGKYYTEREVGNYTQAGKWNYMGHSLVSNTLQSVSQPVLAKINDDKLRQQNVFRKLLRFTSFIAFPVMFGISFISHELIIITITDKWLPAAEILQLLCISGAFIPVIRLYSNLLISRGKSNIYMWNTIGVCLVSLLAVILAYPYGIRNMLIVYVTINICSLSAWHYFLWKEIGLSLWNALKDILPFAGIMLVSIAAAACVLNQAGVENIYLVFAGKIIMTAVFYLSLLWVIQAHVLKESVLFFTRKKIS